MQLLPETSLQGGKYKIEKVLGQGGFGITYLGFRRDWTGLSPLKSSLWKNTVNAKRLLPKFFWAHKVVENIVDRFRIKFIKEAQTIAQMDNPHIIRIHDIFEKMQLHIM